jgi:hypothetical protein
MPGTALERSAIVSSNKFKNPEEELAYLREQVRVKEEELALPKNRFESDRIAKKEIVEYAQVPTAHVLHEDYSMPEHETLRHVLHLDPEEHDTQVDGLLALVAQRGIRNALSVAARMKNPHIEDDLHRALIRYVAEGLPDKGMPPPEKVKRALNLVLFEVQPQAHGEGGEKDVAPHKLEQLLSSSEQLYAGLLSVVGEHEAFSLEIAVPQGTEEAALYLAVPRSKKGARRETHFVSISKRAH